MSHDLLGDVAHGDHGPEPPGWRDKYPTGFGLVLVVFCFFSLGEVVDILDPIELLIDIWASRTIN